jgi:hypothetical protein
MKTNQSPAFDRSLVLARLAALAVLSAVLCHRLTASPQFSESRAWAVGADGYGAHFVYGICVTSDDTILVGTEGRENPALYGDGGPKDLLVKRSIDHGASWSGDVVVENGVYASGYGWGYGQPTFVADGTTTYLFYNGTDKTSSGSTQHIYYRSSTDNGQTWSSRTEITPLWSGNSHGWTVNGPLGHGIKTLRGAFKNTLYLAITHRTGVTSPAGDALYGVDVICKAPASSAWVLAGEPPISLTKGPGEPSIAERANSDLFIIARNVWDSANNPHSRVAGGDDGESWGNWVNTTSAGLVGTSQVSGGLLRFSDGYHLFSYPNNPGSTTRSHMSIGYSTDGGVNWQTPKEVYSGTCNYSDLARDSLGNVYCLYGRGGDNHNVGGSVWVAKFNIEWVTGVAKSTIVVDNTDAGFTAVGSWSTSSGIDGFYGGNYRYSTDALSTSIARWTPTITASGTYEVYIRWSSFSNRPDAAPVKVVYNGGSQTQNVNQQTQGGCWQLLGVYTMNAGTANYVELTASDTGATIADAVMFQQK